MNLGVQAIEFPPEQITTTIETPVELVFSNKFSDNNDRISIIQIEYPENVEYISQVTKFNQTLISESVSQTIEKNIVTLKHESKNQKKGTLIITVILQPIQQTGITTVNWRAIYTSFQAPTSPPIIEDQKGITEIKIINSDYTVSLSTDSETITESQPFNISVTIQNDSPLPITDSFNLSLNENHYEQLNITLAPFETKTMPVTIIPEIVGENILKVNDTELVFNATKQTKLDVSPFAIFTSVLVFYIIISRRRGNIDA